MGPWFGNSSEPEKLLGMSRAIRKIKKQIKIAASYDYPILILGETGVGKTLVARLIHSESKRGAKPFLHQSCSNIPSELFESDLFGHEKGAFTGATERKKGKIEIVDGGTLFLDEIADLSIQSQAKLLLFLESGRFFRVGGTEELSADVKIISASNRDLKREIRAGKFRKDLYFRLNTLVLFIPPLRERKVDIPLLVEEILRRENERCKTSKSISPEVTKKLLGYDFPGNVRELESLIKQAIISSRWGEIQADDILLGQGGLARKRRKVTSDQAEKTLQKYGGNKSKAARKLGISRQSLYKILKQRKM